MTDRRQFLKASVLGASASMLAWMVIVTLYMIIPVRSWLGDVPSRAAISLHLVTKLHHAVLVGLDLRQMERDVFVELFEESDAITN